MAEEDGIRFATFFPGTFYPGSSIHLSKDIGMIPYILHREFGYDSSLIAYGPADESLLRDMPEGLGFLRMPKGIGYRAMKAVKRLFRYDSGFYLVSEALCMAIDSLPVILKHGKSIDVFQVYHFKPESMLAASIYRLLNRNGVVYFKFDMDPDIIRLYEDKPGKNDTPGLQAAGWLFRRMGPVLFSAESRRVYEFLRDGHPLFRQFRDRVLYIPNGVDMKSIPEPFSGPKERIVLHAGRACNPQKGTEVILEAFSRVVKDFPGWKLALVGPMEERYKGRFEDFLQKHQDMRDHIVNAGFLKTKEEVFGWYRRAKILAMPSKFESFGLVAIEAQLFGDSVLGSDIPAIRELTDNGELGYLCLVDDVDCFTRTLRHMMSHEDELAGRAARAPGFVRKNFDWSEICGRLHGRIAAELQGQRCR